MVTSVGSTMRTLRQSVSSHCLVHFSWQSIAAIIGVCVMLQLIHTRSACSRSECTREACALVAKRARRIQVLLNSVEVCSRQRPERSLAMPVIPALMNMMKKLRRQGMRMSDINNRELYTAESYGTLYAYSHAYDK